MQKLKSGPSQNQEITLTLERLQGILEITTGNVVGAEVLVDAELQTLTPAELEIPEGTHEIDVIKERYLPYSTMIDIAGGGTRQNLAIELLPGWSNVQITSQPSGAEIFIDGEPVGITPEPVEVMAGGHPIELRLAGHKVWRSHLEVRANQPQILKPIVLEIADATVRLISEPPGAEVLCG